MSIHGTPAKPEEIRLIRAKYETRGPKVCARLLGRSQAFVYENSRRLGLRYQGVRVHLEFIRNYAPAMGYKWVAQQIGHHHSQVARVGKAHGIHGLKQKGVVTWRRPKCQKPLTS